MTTSNYNTTFNGLHTFPEEELDYLFGEDRVKTFTDWPASVEKDEIISGGWMSQIPTSLEELRDIVPNLDDLLYGTLENHGNTVRDNARHLASQELRTTKGWELPFKKFKPGWSRIDGHNKVTPTTTPPEFSIAYFDSETFVKFYNIPVFGQLLTTEGLFLWVNPGVFGEEWAYHVPLEGKGEYPNNSVLIAHNSGFDSGKVSGTFTGTIKWMDTLGMAAATFHHEKSKSLSALYTKFTKKKLSKAQRDTFVKMETIDELVADWEESLAYSLNDLNPLAVVFENLMPYFEEVKPHPISWLGHTNLATQVMPIDLKVVEDARKDLEANVLSLEEKVTAILSKCCEEHLKFGPSVFTRAMDWTPVGETGSGSQKYAEWIGLPTWYAEMKATRLDVYVQDEEKIKQLGGIYGGLFALFDKVTAVPMITKKRTGINLTLGESELPITKSIRSTEEEGYITSPFGKSQEQLDQVRSLILTLDEIKTLQVWSQFSRQLGWLKGYLLNVKPFSRNGIHQVGAGACPNATLTGRTGKGFPTLIKGSSVPYLHYSETRNRVSAPEGYTLIRWDFDSQESVIAALAGNSDYKKGNPAPIGRDRFSRACLTGTKSNDTDYHSTIAKVSGLPMDKANKKASRKIAKVINLGMQFGTGNKKLASNLIAEADSVNTFDEGFKLATDIRLVKEGERDFYTGEYHGGIESSYKNFIDNWVKGDRKELAALFLGSKPPQDHAVETSDHKIKNFVCQGGGGEMLNIVSCIFNELVLRKGWTYDDCHLVMTVHDEFVALCREEIKFEAARVLQYAHLLVWTYCLRALNIPEICIGRAYAETVDISKHWTKDPEDTAITPTNLDGFETGKSYTMEELMNHREN